MRHTHRLLVRHILAIRQIPIFSHCKAVLIFESNLAFESQHLLHALENNGVKNWVSLSEGQQGSLGWLTTNERKVRAAQRSALSLAHARRREQEQMCLLLREAMNVGRVAISDYFFSVELQQLEARKRIKDELLNYCVVTEAPKTTFGKIRKTYTGKLYGKQARELQYLLRASTDSEPWSLSGRPRDRAAAGDDRGAKGVIQQ